MNRYFADLHVHVGCNEEGRWVKIPTSRRLTVRNILWEAAHRKGMQIVGIVDALSPLVQRDLDKLIAEGLLSLTGSGGYRYDNRLTLLLGAEIETSETSGGVAHTMIFLPDMPTMKEFTALMARHIKNITLSSQNAHMNLASLVQLAANFSAMVIPAHVFTPHKSLYGVCTDHIGRLLSDRLMGTLAGVELGLSSDTDMADRIAELADFSFVTNSDAHSPDKIAREYNIFTLLEPTFAECLAALRRSNERGIAGNYGLDPRLGKYHRTFCAACEKILPPGPPDRCPRCGSADFIRGVADRIDAISDYPSPVHPVHRPAYHYQVPLEFIPGVGGKTLDKLLAAFDTEMNVLHQASSAQLEQVVGSKTAANILRARAGEAQIAAGGGGLYGRIL